MTLAERFKSKRRPDYTSPAEFFKLIKSIDGDAETKLIGDQVIIIFSDGSTELMLSYKE